MAGDRSPYSCPGCWDSDRIQRVSALYSAGISSTNYDTAVTGVAGSNLLVGVASGRATTVSALADEVRPAPAVKSGGWLIAAGIGWLILLLLPSAAMFQANAQGAAASGSGSPWSNVVGIFILAGWPSIIFVSFGLARASRRARVDRGSARAFQLWHEGWYCDRCGRCYFPPTVAVPGLAAGTLLHPAQFRYAVWATGGYADIHG